MGGWGTLARSSGKGVSEAAHLSNTGLQEGGGSGLAPQGKGRLRLLTCRIRPCGRVGDLGSPRERGG